MNEQEKLKSALERLGQLHRYRDILWENIDTTDEVALTVQVLSLVFPVRSC